VYKVTPLDTSSIDAHITLLNNLLGEGFISHSELLDFIGDSNKVVFRITNVDNPKEALGIATGIIINSRESFNSLVNGFEPEFTHIANEISDINKVLIIKSVAVSEEHAGNGFGTKLVQAIFKWAENKAPKSAISLGWEDGNGCHIEKVLQRNEMSRIATRENFWLEDSITRQYNCPSCGNPCRCSAVLFYRSLI
jgi:GNAT superfamily N-acetyltransferase